MICFPVAKINLGLNVVERRPDGYHNLETVFFPVPLCDTLEVLPSPNTHHPTPNTHHPTPNTHHPTPITPLELCSLATSGTQEHPTPDCDLKVSSNGQQFDTGDVQRNLVVRAYQLLQQEFGDRMSRVHAHLFKAIPTQAGMGGGSSDCAAMLVMLNEMFRLGLSEQQLIDRAARLGADCPFFVMRRPAYAEGIGERLQPVSLDLSGWYLAVVRPDIPVSTKEAFSLIQPHRPPKNCLDIVMQPVDTWRDELTNDFEQSVFAHHPEIGAVKERLYQLGAVYAAMSGSGSAVFGLFREPVALDDHFPDMFTYTTKLN